jgi:hypothetical protein
MEAVSTSLHPADTDSEAILGRYTAVDWILGGACLLLCVLALLWIRTESAALPGTPGADGHVLMGGGLFGAWFLFLGWWPGRRLTTSLAKVLAFAFAWFLVLALLGSVEMASWRLALVEARDLALASWLVAFAASLPIAAAAMLFTLKRLAH